MARPVPAPRSRWQPATASALRGISQALALLAAPAQGLTPEELLAQREQLRIDAEAARTRQQVLSLGDKEAR